LILSYQSKNQRACSTYDYINIDLWKLLAHWFLSYGLDGCFHFNCTPHSWRLTFLTPPFKTRYDILSIYMVNKHKPRDKPRKPSKLTEIPGRKLPRESSQCNRSICTLTCHHPIISSIENTVELEAATTKNLKIHRHRNEAGILDPSDKITYPANQKTAVSETAQTSTIRNCSIWNDTGNKVTNNLGYN
jgi:hypothetical protein